MSLEFEKNTIDPTLFIVEDVIGDNACCYRALANGLFHRSYYNTKDEIIEHIGDWNYFKKNTKEHVKWGFCSYEQENMARYIQNEILDFIITHKDTKLDTFSKKFVPYAMTFSDLIEMTHEMDMDEYVEHYSVFAGDPIFITTEDGDIEEADGRWGGLPEQIAFSYRFKIPIIVYSCQKFSKRYNKIISGRIRNNKAEKGVRFLVTQCIGEEFIETTPPILLLWKKSRKGDHYMALYQKCKNHIFLSDGSVMLE